MRNPAATTTAAPPKQEDEDGREDREEHDESPEPDESGSQSHCLLGSCLWGVWDHSVPHMKALSSTQGFIPCDVHEAVWTDEVRDRGWDQANGKGSSCHRWQRWSEDTMGAMYADVTGASKSPKRRLDRAGGASGGRSSRAGIPRDCCSSVSTRWRRRVLDHINLMVRRRRQQRELLWLPLWLLW